MREETVAAPRETGNLGRMHSAMLLVGAILMIVCILFMVNPDSRQQMLQSYMWGWVFWAGLAFGCFAMTLLHHSLKGSWGTAVMRIWEAGGGPVSLIGFAVLF